ncbi:MAG: DUF1707 and DUF2154 domain-containing protein [Pseudonocardia sp.]|nr:DUF1707 and DUF2154 domain-containing protein [Pseudonocardia sp.]
MVDAGEDARNVIRVGDTERRAVDDLLQRAHGEGRVTLTEYEERAAGVWAARTQADLDALTADLPPADLPPTALPATGREPVVVGRKAVDRDADDGAPSWARRAVGVLGTVVVAAARAWGGGQVVSADDGAVVFSARTVPVAPGDDRIELGVLFGRADIVVPDDTRVNLAARTIFGSVDCEAACAGPGSREITVDVSGAFGSVDVLTQSEAAAAAAEDAAEDAVEDAEDAAEDAIENAEDAGR